MYVDDVVSISELLEIRRGLQDTLRTGTKAAQEQALLDIEDVEARIHQLRGEVIADGTPVHFDWIGGAQMLGVVSGHIEWRGRTRYVIRSGDWTYYVWADLNTVQPLTDPFADLPVIDGWMPIGSEFAIAIAKTAAADAAQTAQLAQERMADFQHQASAAADELVNEEFGHGNWTREDWLAIYQSDDTRIRRHLHMASWWMDRAREFRVLADGITALIPERLLPELTPPF
jgi:hypothetical protein